MMMLTLGTCLIFFETHNGGQVMVGEVVSQPAIVSGWNSEQVFF